MTGLIEAQQKRDEMGRYLEAQLSEANLYYYIGSNEQGSIAMMFVRNAGDVILALDHLIREWDETMLQEFAA